MKYFLSNIINIINNQLPVVFHVTSQHISDELELTADHSSVLDLLFYDINIINSDHPQESYDMTIISHIYSRKFKKPIIHFFDGVSIGSRQFNKIKVCKPEDQLRIYNSNNQNLENILQNFGKITGKYYHEYEFFGSNEPDILIISTVAGSGIIEDLISNLDIKIGILKIRILNKKVFSNLYSYIPITVKKIIVLEYSKTKDKYGLFSQLILTALYNKNYTISCQKISDEDNYQSIRKIINDSSPIVKNKDHQLGIINELVLWLADNDLFIEQLIQLIGIQQTSEGSRVPPGNLSGKCSELSINVQLINNNLPNFGKRIDIRLFTADSSGRNSTSLGSERYIKYPNNIISKCKLLVLDEEFFSTKITDFDPVKNLQINGTLLILSKSENLQLEQILPSTMKRDLYCMKIKIFIIKPDIKQLIDIIYNQSIPSKITEFMIPIGWEIATPDESLLPVNFPLTIIQQLSDKKQNINKPSIDLIYSLLFPEIYQTTYISNISGNGITSIKISDYKRLTPIDYDRNIFHMELDITDTAGGSGLQLLKYEIGDALGIYAKNDYIDVINFIHSYGWYPNEIISSRNSNGLLEYKTIQQVLIHNLDIFGMPGKKFYCLLADLIDNTDVKSKILEIANNKKELLARKEEGITYADLLLEFSNHKLSIKQIIEIIPNIKPRHYSISSSMKMHPNSIHLLIVAVDWVTPKGRKKYGLCTRYLVSTKIGDYLTVSIKPSAMKLPEDHTRPIIMAGLGTGMAPFRAFIEERAYFRKIGINVGPIILYFGSRNRNKEYLYGEELDKYHSEGLITILGLAFSRDQPEKIYIQDKIKDNSEIIYDYLINEGGYFYLCGPTWPVTDVKAALIYSFTKYGNITEIAANKILEKMKDHERYVLEVY